MKKEINETIYTCDKCGKEIKDVVYMLYCYAEQVGDSLPCTEVAIQNMKQNLSHYFSSEKHLCRRCKDSITDGVFIL